MFAAQQALEGIVWITLKEGDSISLLHNIGVYGFLFFSNLFWPVFVPYSLYILEENKLRKKLLLSAFFLGVGVLLIFLFLWWTQERSAQIQGHHIVYTSLSLTLSTLHITHIYLIKYVFFIAYLMSTVGVFFISSIRYIWVLGIILGIGLLATVFYSSQSLVSIWCFFAAMGSIFIYFIVVKPSTHAKI